MGWIGNSWEGEEDLWKVAWIYGAFLIFIGSAVIIAIRLFTDIAIDSPASGAGKARIIFETVYSVWLLVSLWRCAYNVRWKCWSYLIRFFVLLYVLIYCFLCYVEKTILVPEAMAAEIQTLVNGKLPNLLNGNGTDTAARPIQKKKPTYMIKVNKI